MNEYYYKNEYGLEVKDVLSEDHTRFTEREAFYFGNIIKYIKRAGKKEDDVNESLKKAMDYYHYLVSEYYNKNNNDLLEFKLYVKRRIRTACISLGCVKNYNAFIDNLER